MQRDAGRSDERQHFLQPVTIRRPRGLPGVDELPHDPRAEFVGLAVIRLALGGDGEPFLGAAALGLLTSRHPQVGDGEEHRLVVAVVGGHAHRGEGGSGVRGHAVLLRCSGSGSRLSSTLPRRSGIRLRF